MYTKCISSHCEGFKNAFCSFLRHCYTTIWLFCSTLNSGAIRLESHATSHQVCQWNGHLVILTKIYFSILTIALCVFPCLKFLNVNIHFMLISNKKISIPFVGDAKIPKFWAGIKNFIISTPNMTFLERKLKGWSDKVGFFVTYRSNHLQK